MRPLMRASCFLIVLSSFVANSHAADKWLSVRSKNFLLVGNASESSMRRVGRDLEQFRAALAMLFPGVNQQSTIDTTVVVFKDDASFRSYKPLYEGKAANVAGFFQAGQDVNFIALSADARSTQVVYHEFVHSLTKDTALPLPLWASEGLAEVYSMFEVTGKEFTLGRAIAEHIATLNLQRMLSLNLLLSVESISPYYNEKTKQGMFYAQSWASVHYLLFANNGKRRPQLTKYLNLAFSSKTTDENFRDAFETDYGTLEEEIRRYVQNQVSWPAINMKLPDKLDFDAEMQVSVLSEAQSQYYLGDLLLHMNRLDVAETQLQQAIALDPQFSPTYASLALLRVRQGKSGEALAPLARAVERDSKNYLAHFYYAYMLQERAASAPVEDQKAAWDLIRFHAERTIELAPHFTEAYGMLGYVALVSKQGTVAAEAALKKAIGFAPGRLELRLRLAELMIANAKAADAKPILTALTTGRTDDAIRAQAERLLDNIKNREQYERDLKEYEQRRRVAEDAAVNDNSPAAGHAVDDPPQ
jgi:Tfp pilus assembly protein PilF